MVGLGLRVARQHKLSPIGGGYMHVHHLNGLEFGDHFARCDAASGNPEPGLERDLQAVGQEGNEDMGFDSWLDAMVDGSDAQIML